MSAINELLFGNGRVVFQKALTLTISYANTSSLMMKLNMVKPHEVGAVYEATITYYNDAYHDKPLNPSQVSVGYINHIKNIFASNLYKSNLSRMAVTIEEVLTNVPSFVLYVLVAEFAHIRRALRAESREFGTGLNSFTTMVYQSVVDGLKFKEKTEPALNLDTFSGVAKMQLMELLPSSIFEDEDY